MDNMIITIEDVGQAYVAEAAANAALTKAMARHLAGKLSDAALAKADATQTAARKHREYMAATFCGAAHCTSVRIYGKRAS